MGIRRAFTLVEILIVVLILGILAALVVPQFATATEDAQREATLTELQKLRRHIEVFEARNAGLLPDVEEGDGTWGQLVGTEYLTAPPINAWVGWENGREIVFGAAPDDAYHTDYGWIFDPDTGEIWAAAYDANDEPLPRP
jgi:general secretion pathway protein G